MISKRWFRWERLGLMIGGILQVWGTFTILSAVLDFFPSLNWLSLILQQRNILWLILAISVIYALATNRPRSSFSYQIKNRDAEIELRIGNIFNTDTAFVIPINSEFDLHLNGSVKSSPSLQSKMIADYFNSDKIKLGKLIKKELGKENYTQQKDGSRYKLGTTVYLKSCDEKQGIYLLANSHKINSSRVQVTPSDFYETLPEFWSFVGTHCPKEEIAMPLIGTGNGRLTISREEVYKEIVRSFVASCAGKICCSKLIIVLQEEDIEKYGIDISNLVDFTRLQALYNDFTNDSGVRTGSPVE